MGEPVYFIFFIASYGAMGLGQIVQSQFDLWKESGHKPQVLYPKRFNLIPMTEKHSKEIVGYNISITPMQMHKTKQKEIFMDLAEVEILGEVETQTDVLVCNGDGKELFNELYLDAIKKWEIELTGLSVASPEETAALLKNNVMPFPGKRK